MLLSTELLLNTIPVSRTPLGAFANLREATISFVTSVRLHGSNLSHGIFMKYDISGFFENLSRNFKLYFIVTKIKPTFSRHLCTFVITSS